MRVNQRYFGGKRGRHSSSGFRENVVVAETSYQRLDVLSFCDRGGAKRPLKKTALTFPVKKN